MTDSCAVMFEQDVATSAEYASFKQTNKQVYEDHLGGGCGAKLVK
jgi:hypothetical protein